MKKWHVVYKGRVPGVYDEWEDCLNQVNKFGGNSYKAYKSKEEAEARYMNHLLGEERKNNRMKTFIVIPILLIVIAFLLYLIVV
jgi:ribonuclease HI